MSTVTMVERIIKKSDEPRSRTQLWKVLPKKIMYPTFKKIIDYLEASNKIMYDKNGKIVWIAGDNHKLGKFFKRLSKTALVVKFPLVFFVRPEKIYYANFGFDYQSALPGMLPAWIYRPHI